MTRFLDLPTQTKSIWFKAIEPQSRRALELETTVDVAIVGAGVTGLTAALLLAEAGRRVAVVERGEIGSGDSGFTTGHLATVLDMRFKKLIHNFGVDDARIAAACHRQAIGQIVGIISRHQIECELGRLPGYLFSESLADQQELEDELSAARQCGETAELVPDSPLPFSAGAVLRIENQGRFHVMRYLHGLAAAVEKYFGSIFENTQVLEYEEGTPCILRTSSGIIHAENIILATHCPLGRILTIHSRVPAYRSYALACRLEEAFPDALFWDMDHPYHYLRRMGSGAPNTLIAGGADHKTGSEQNTNEAYQCIAQYVGERFQPRAIEARWSSQTFESPDGLPYIGRLPFTERIFFATGFGGNGMTLGTASAALLAGEILEEGDRQALRIFSPSRVKPMASAKSVIVEGLDAAKHMVKDWFSGPELEGVSDLSPGDGRLIEIDGRKLAVYRNEIGEITVLSPICTHLGCTVKWNEAERTWDCPCHGSRFAATGEAIEAPAIQGLEITGSQVERISDHADNPASV